MARNSIEGTLDEQRLDVGSTPADSGGFLLPGTLVVLRCKTSPGAKVLRGGKHGHINVDFRNDTDCGKGFDYGCLNFLSRSFNALVEIRNDIERFVAFQQPGCYCSGSLTKYVRKHIVQLDVQAVLRTVLFSSGKAGQFPVITH